MPLNWDATEPISEFVFELFNESLLKFCHFATATPAIIGPSVAVIVAIAAKISLLPPFFFFFYLAFAQKMFQEKRQTGLGRRSE